LTAQEITRQGYILASNEVFWVAGWLFIVMIGLVWFARPPFRQASGGDAGGAH
jgi:DHA2 family multidrug resistance protein